MNPVWERSFTERISASDMTENRLIEQGKKECGLLSKIGFTVKNLFTLSKPNYDELYLSKGKAYLAQKNFEYLSSYQTTHSPEITEVVLGALMSKPPEKHLVSREEVELAEALFALDMLQSPKRVRAWLKQEWLDKVVVTEANASLILNIENLDSLQKNGRGQGHKFTHCFNEVMGTRAIDDLKSKDVKLIREKFQAWVSVSPPPDHRSFKVISDLTGDNHIALNQLLRIGQKQVARVNTDNFYQGNFKTLINEYSRNKPMDQWNQVDFSRIERITTLWTTHIPEENIAGLNYFLDVASALNGKDFDQTTYIGLDDATLSSLESIFEIKSLIRYPASEVNQGHLVGKAIVKLIDKDDISEVTQDDLEALKTLLTIHSKNTEVSFKEFYKLFEALPIEERDDLEQVVAGYPGYKKMVSLIPGMTPTVKGYLDISKDLKASEGWKHVQAHFQRTEKYPIPPQFEEPYHKLLKHALANNKMRLFTLATEVVPGHPNPAACLFKDVSQTGSTEMLDVADVEGWLYSLKMLYNDTPESLHAHLDSSLESCFRELFTDSHDLAFGTTVHGYPKNQTEVSDWIQKSLTRFNETTGATRMTPDKAVKITADEKEIISRLENEFKQREVLTSHEIGILTNYLILDHGYVDEALLHEFLLERENLKVLENSYPPLFRRLLVEELKACDIKIIQGLKSLNENHLYTLPLAIQGLQAARRLSLEQATEKSSITLDDNLLERIMTTPSPKDASEVEKRLLGIYVLQECYGMLIRNNKNSQDLVKEFVSKVGDELVHQEFAGKAGTTDSLVEVLSGVIARVQQVQSETSLPSSVIFDAILEMQQPNSKELLKKIQEWAFGSKEPSFVERLDYIREALDTEDGKTELNKILLKKYSVVACGRALTGEFLKSFDHDAIALYASEISSLFKNRGAQVNERVQGHVYHLAKVAIHFVNEGYSPFQVFRFIKESTNVRLDLDAVACGSPVSEAEYLPLANELNERLSKAPATNPWNNLTTKMIHQPELFISKILPALVEGMAKDVDSEKLAFVRSKLEEVAEIVKYMPIKGEVTRLAEENKELLAEYNFSASIFFSLLTLEPGKVKEAFHSFRPDVFKIMSTNVKDANNVINTGGKTTGFPLEEKIDLFVNIVEQTRIKNELLVRAGGDEDIVSLSPVESLLIHVAPKLEETVTLRIAKFALSHAPQIFNLQKNVNRSVTKFLLGFMVDWYLAESGFEEIGKKEDIKKLLDPIIDIIGDVSPIVQENHQIERYLGFVRGINKAVNSSEEEFDPLEVKKLIINALGSLFTEVEGYSAGLEKVLTEVGHIAGEE